MADFFRTKIFKRGEATQRILDLTYNEYRRDPHPQPAKVAGKGHCPKCGTYYAKGLHLHYKHCGMGGSTSE